MKALRIIGLVLAIILIAKNYISGIALYLNEQIDLAEKIMDKGQLYLFLLCLAAIIYKKEKKD